MEIIFELLAELILQIVGELLAELGLRSFRETVKRPANPVIASIGYTILGAAAGGISLLVHAQHFTETMELRIAAVVLVPLAAGGARCCSAPGVGDETSH
jgi:hypothetical protein